MPSGAGLAADGHPVGSLGVADGVVGAALALGESVALGVAELVDVGVLVTVGLGLGLAVSDGLLVGSGVATGADGGVASGCTFPSANAW